MSGFARSASARLFHALCAREVRVSEQDYFEERFEAGFGSTDRFFARLPAEIQDLEGKSVPAASCERTSKASS